MHRGPREERETKRIWNWLTSHLDSRLATSVAVGAFLGLAVFEVLKYVIGLAVVVVLMPIILIRAC